MNKVYRLVWNELAGVWVAVAEHVKAHGKRSSGVILASAAMITSALAQTVPAPNTLPTGGQVVAGQAAIAQSGATMTINQGSQRAAIDWNTFNVGSQAQVNFVQPNSSAVALNRVQDGNPSQIFGRITANGQVFLSNPGGVYFAPGASVNVGGLVATTHRISLDDFMAGRIKFDRNGATGSIINEGELKAAIGGYIALLAPEVRNQGVIIANLGTVALAAGESYELQFDGNNTLASLRVTPSTIKALVDNRSAVLAPGGLIILSALAVDRVQAGVIKNSGRLEATGMQQRGGRIVLDASDRIENTGSIAANAGTDGPAGSVSLRAPEIVNSGNIEAKGNSASPTGGSIQIDAGNFTHTGSLDVSAPVLGGSVAIRASGQVEVSGKIDASTTSETSQGGEISVQAAQITTTDAMLDTSGGQGGSIVLNGGAPSPDAPSAPLPAPAPGKLALNGGTQLTSRGRRGKGGTIALLGDDLALNDTTALDASGATGGGNVLVGGDWQGSGTLYQATTVTMAQGASIDASATQSGDGGKVVLWSDVHNANSKTTVNGSITARGGAKGGNGGQVETSGHNVNIDTIRVNAGADKGTGGLWLIDPYNYTIGIAQASTIVGNASTGLNSGTSVTVDTSGNDSTQGSSGINSDAGDITVTAAINKSLGGDAIFTLKAARHIVLQSGANFSSSSGKLNLQFWADSDNSGDGINMVSATSIATNGGWIKFGNNQTASINGSNVLVGGDVFFNSASAQTLSTGGGSLNIYGETILANSSGVTINTSGGNVTFSGVLNSGNQYTWVDETANLNHDWNWARNDAKNGTVGGSAIGNSYLVTITSRLENAIAGLTAGYRGAWIGAFRANPASSFAWTWADGPEAGVQFFTQNSSGGGGTTEAGYYSNYGSGEPNGTLAANESVGQFFGTAGQWNDLSQTTIFSATQSSQYNVLGYVREINLAPTALTINAGSGAVVFNNSVGGSKALSSLTVNAASTAVNGTALVTTGAQTYNNALTVNSSGAFLLSGNSLAITNANQALSLTAAGDITIDSPVSVDGSISVNGANIALNNNLAATASAAAILVSATGNITTANSAKTITTNNGNISLIGDSDASGAGQLDLDYMTMSAGTGNVLVRGETFSWNVGAGMTPTVSSTTGTFTWESSDASFGQIVDTAWFNLPSTLSGLTIGKSTNTQNVTTGNALSVDGSISLYGSNITLNAGLTATGTNTISLTATGNVTEGASGYVSADKLALLGGNVTLTNASNAIGTLAASGVSGLAYTDSNALTIGTVGSTNGITATGAVVLTAGATLTTTQAINAGSGNITLTTDSLALGANVISTGAVQIQPKTASATLGVGNGNGTLQIGADQLAWLQDGFSSITLGGSATGAVQIGGLSTWNDPLVAQAGTGADLQVVGNMSWSHANSLTLKAGNNIYVNANLAAFNNAAALNILYGGTDGTTAPTVGTNYYVNLANRNTIQLTGSAPTLKLGNASYTVVNDVTVLQGMIASNNYALGHGLSLAGTTYSTAFYTPTFTGKFDGLGNALDGLTISNTAGGNLGLFAQVNGATVRQVGVTNMSITTNSTDLGTSANTTEYRVGGVIGNVGGAGAPISSVTTLDGIWSTGAISTTAGSGQKFFLAGGLLGSQNGGTMNLSRSYSLANVSSQGSYSSNLAIGGLIGDIGINTNLVSHTATTSSTVAFTISKDYSTGSIVEGSHGGYYGTGGLVGVVFSTGNSILDSYSWSNVVGNSVSFGGIAGFALAGTYDRLYTTQSSVGNMTGGTGTSVYNGSTLSTSGGTVLPSGFSSNDWGIGTRPTLKLIPTPPTPVYVKESTTAGTYGTASTAYQLVDASGNPITLGSGSYAGLSGTTGTAHYSLDIGNTTTPGTYSLSYLSGLSFTGANALDFILNPSSTATSYTLAKAPITVTANNASKVYDGLVYSGGYSVSYSAFANGETSSVLGGALSFSGTSQTATNSGTYTISSSGLTSNNYTFTYVNGSLNIDKRPLTLSGSRAYDGTASISAGVLTAGNLVGSDCSSGLTACGMTGSGSMASKDVSAGNQTLSLTGLSLAGAIASNYTLTGGSGTVHVTAKTVTLSASKTYDGTTGLTGNVSLTAGVGSETLGYTGATASDAHVATANKYISALTLADATDSSGGLASNYQLPTLDAANAPVSILTKALTATAGIGGTLVKTYDGTTSATGASVSGNVGGAVSGDTIALDASGVSLAYNSAHVLAANSITASGSAGFTIGTTASGSQATDYSFSAPGITDVAASITPATLTVSLTNTGVTKTYDGTTSAPAGFVPAWGVTGLVTGDMAASVASTGAAYNSKDVLDANKVTVTGASLTGAISGSNSSLTSDYALASTSVDVAATITPKTVTVGGLVADNKTYDGTTNASMTNWGAVSTGVGTETLVLNHGGATFADANANTGKTVTASGYALVDGSGLASNYQLSSSSATTTADISKALLTVIANNDAKFVTQGDNNPAYNGVSYNGFVNGETSSVLSGAATITRNNSSVNVAGSYNGVLVPNASGLAATNYSFQTQNGNYTIVGSNQLLVWVSNTSKTYGSASSYSITGAEYYNGSAVVPLPLVTDNGNGNFTISDGVGGSATFTLRPTSAGLSGAGMTPVGSYQLGFSGLNTTNGQNFASALSVVGNETVLAKALTASASSGISKTYDGTTSMTGVNIALTGLETNDAVTVSGNGAFTSTHAGSNVGYAISNLALGSTDANNYYLSGGASFSGSDGTILAKTLTATASIGGTLTKTYDGTTSVTGASVSGTVSGAVSGDTISLSTGGVSLAYNSAHVQGANSITASGSTGFTIDGSSHGSLASDYSFTTPAIADAAASITPATLTASLINTGVTKTYDGTTNAPAGFAPAWSVTGLVTGDTAAGLTSTGAAYNSEDVVTANKVTVSGASLTGVSGGNGSLTSDYALASTSADVAATITGGATSDAGSLLVLPAPVPYLPLPTPDRAPPILGDAQAGIVVQLVKMPTAQSEGLITVTLTKAIALAGFSFDLPRELIEEASTDQSISVSQMNGMPLPAWIHFVPERMRFEARSVPAGALPLKVLITIGGNSTVVVIEVRGVSAI